MSRPDSCFPSPEEGLSFHLRLCNSDPTAPAEFFKAYLVPLGQWLAVAFPTVDEHLRGSAVHDPLIKYVLCPQAYDPRRMDLGAYLRMAARSDLLNLLRDENRHHQKRVPWSVVELGEEGGNLFRREEEPSLQLERAEEEEQRQAFLQSVREGLTEQENQVLELMLAGVRETGAYACVLGITHLPPAEQAQEVKRVKDRIRKRLERGGGQNG
jgi:DNA-directed RNA polymerase specialized sigma24 family protein